MSLFTRICNKNACTCWFDKLGKSDWKECCIEHDKDIIECRTSSSLKADIKLFKCVYSKGLVGKLIAPVMLIGVIPMSYIARKFIYKHK